MRLRLLALASECGAPGEASRPGGGASGHTLILHLEVICLFRKPNGALPRLTTQQLWIPGADLRS